MIKLYEEKEWADYENMQTNIEGMENITYEEKRNLALNEVKEYISDCTSIEEVAEKIKNDPETFFESGRLYLGFAVVAVYDENKDRLWWATRDD